MRDSVTALKNRVDALYLEYVFPVLATLRLGEDPAAVAFETELLAAARAAGIRVRRYIMPADLSFADVERLIGEINADFLLSALLIVKPPEGELDAARMEALIAPAKRLAEAPVPELLEAVVDAAERRAKQSPAK